MQWIEISVVCERVATDEVTTLFDDYTDNGIIEEDVENQPNLIKLTMYADSSFDMDMIKADLEKHFTTLHFTSIVPALSEYCEQSPVVQTFQKGE